MKLAEFNKFLTIKIDSKLRNILYQRLKLETLQSSVRAVSSVAASWRRHFIQPRGDPCGSPHVNCAKFEEIEETKFAVQLLGINYVDYS